MNIHEMETRCLLHSYVQIRDELMRRKITHSARNLIGDYTQWCVVNALDLNFDSGCFVNGKDGVDESGNRYLIRGKFLSGKAKETFQRITLKKQRKQKFDLMVVVVFNEALDVQNAWLIPHRLVFRYASFNNRSKTHTLILSRPLLSHANVESVKDRF